jgi:hypothetical protein
LQPGVIDPGAAMDEVALVQRIEMLEETMKSLKGLPRRVDALELRMAGVESQVLQLRTEMRDGFLATATKADLERFATKEDLERFATKADLERYATKADLAGAVAELREEIAGGVREMAGQLREFERRSEGRMRILIEDAMSRAITRIEGNPRAQ